MQKFSVASASVASDQTMAANTNPRHLTNFVFTMEFYGNIPRPILQLKMEPPSA
jgi:hypothetical protein